MRGVTRSSPTRPPADEATLTRRGRMIALVMVGAMLAWLGVQALGAAMGWPGGLALVFDAAALVAFAWALVSTYWLWRLRRGSGPGN